MDLGLAGGTWIVTGGTSGLGLAAAAAICAEGGRVIVVGRNADKAAAAAAWLPGEADAVAGDLADPDLAERILAVATQGEQPVRGALLSVGGPPPGIPTSVTDEAWRAAFESVLLGPVRLTRALVDQCPHFESMAWVLSSSAKSPIAGLTISNGLRPGLAMLVKDFADELGPRGIRVNGLLPGRFDTPRLQELEARRRRSGRGARAVHRLDPAAALRGPGRVRGRRGVRAVPRRVLPERQPGDHRRWVHPGPVSPAGASARGASGRRCGLELGAVQVGVQSVGCQQLLVGP